jgi:SAM-dependent methyltransferase
MVGAQTVTARSVPPVIYQHPLAYLLGIEGLALMHAWTDDDGKDFVEARLAEIRRLLDDKALTRHPGVMVRRGDAPTGYRQWAASYDEPRNSLFDFDEPVMHAILGGLPSGAVLDAACGTGRYSAYLAARGHHVIGVDNSADMLSYARVRVPEGRFVVGDLCALPAADSAIDLVVCALALAHLPALEPAMAEFARVLRPGGHLVISDIHHERVFLGSLVHALGPAGEPGVVATYRHTAGDFVRAAVPAGFYVRRCEEPRLPVPEEPPPRPPTAVEDWEDWNGWPWSLMDLVPDAMSVADQRPVTIIWHFQLAS